MSQLIDVNSENAVLTISLNRPDKKNALTGAMYTELAEILESRVDDVSAVILTGGTLLRATTGRLSAESSGGRQCPGLPLYACPHRLSGAGDRCG